MSQNGTKPEAAKSKRRFLMHPAFILVESFLLLGVLLVIAIVNYPSKEVKEDFTGIATVEHVNGGQRCYLDLRTEDGVFLDNLRMTSGTCRKVSEGDVIEVVKGKDKYLREIAERSS
ncbi:hypothetical protein [Arthrobacter sp. Z4-13]